MSRRPVSPIEAEQYELPSLPGRNRLDNDKLDSEDGDVRQDGGKHPEEEEALLNDSLGYNGDVREEEIVGKGSKIEQLIADVSRRSIAELTHSLYRLQTTRHSLRSPLGRSY
jgi:hypothetical protein